MEWKSCSHLATSTSASRTTSRPSAGSKSSSPGAKLLLLLQARCPVRGYQPGQRLGQRSKEIKRVKEIVNRLVSKVWGVWSMSLGVAIILLSYLISWSSGIWWFGQRQNWTWKKYDQMSIVQEWMSVTPSKRSRSSQPRHRTQTPFKIKELQICTWN